MAIRTTASGEGKAVPPRALVLSVLALAVPVLGVVAFPGWLGDGAGMLIWLTALVPAFLLTYYRGWQGSSVALAGGMAALALAHLLMEVVGLGPANYAFLLWIVATFIAVCVGVGVLAEILRRERNKAEDMALTDSLTGIPNRRHAGIFLDAQFSAAVRGQPLTAVIIDLDHFKDINDRYGHRAGDDVLRRLGAILAEVTRKMDLTARWGGEEFLSLLSECEAEGGAAFVGRVQEKLRNERFPWGGVTVSAGIAEYEHGMGSPELLVAAADQALYRAKTDGRDCWRMAGRAPDEVAAGQGAAPSARPASPAPAPRRRPSVHTERSALLVATEEDPHPIVPDETPDSTDPGRHPGGWEKILLVDDNGPAREAIARILRRLGYTVLEAGDGESALAKARDLEEVDLLVTDLLMPGMSGFSLAERVEEELGPHRILYMSGYVQAEVAWKGAPGAAVDFLEKPMSTEDLARRVRAILDRAVSGSGERAASPVS